MIEKLTCQISDSIIDVMKVINENVRGIAFILNENRKLAGVVTDGDIRRALMDGTGLQEKVEKIIQKEFTWGRKEESYESLTAKINHRVKIIPLVNEQNEVVDFFEYAHSTYFPIAFPTLGGNEFKYLTDAFMSTWISSSGEYIRKFEKHFSSYIGCEYGVACSNGTTALHLALESLGLGEGDEVIVPDLTFVATINAVLYTRARPVIVDVEEDSWCIDPLKVEKAVTPRTKAVIPVHLYGQPCNMELLMDIAERYYLKVVEDCAEAHGAMYNDKKVGSFGDIGCFSFFANKVITTGEGGMCVTRDHELSKKMKLLRDHGMSSSKKYWHDVVGYNYRMTNLQAAIGLAQLERVDEIIRNRKTYEAAYKDSLNHKRIVFQRDIEKRKRIVWLVSVLLNENEDREACIKSLKKNRIDARPFFYPLSDMDIYKEYCNKQTPVAHKLSKLGINLPTYESLKNLNEIKNILKKDW